MKNTPQNIKRGYILSFLFAPIGFYLCYKGLKQIDAENPDGKYLAYTGMVISLLMTLFFFYLRFSN